VVPRALAIGPHLADRLGVSTGWISCTYRACRCTTIRRTRSSPWLRGGSRSRPVRSWVARRAPHLPPASFVHLPAGMPHYAWVEGETIVQINGAGPFDVTYVDPKGDPRNH
jgi:hypothetical protein